MSQHPQIFRTPCGLIVLRTHWELLLRNIDCGKHTLITGPTGSGKTSLAIEAARDRGRPVEVFHFSAIFDVEATVTGTTQLRNGETHFVRSRFINALTTPGCMIVADELNRSPGAVPAALMSLLDGQRRLPVDTDDGERRIVECAEGVAVIATANIGAEYVQTEPLDTALLNRFLFLRLNFPEPAQEQQLLEERGVEAQRAAWLTRVVTEIRKANARGELAAAVSTRSLLEAGELVRDGFPTELAFETVVPAFDDPGIAKLRTIVRATK